MGRWRYRVTARDVRQVHAPKVLMILFRRRADAAAFIAKADTFGPQAGADHLGACGYRRDRDFRIETNALINPCPGCGSIESMDSLRRRGSRYGCCPDRPGSPSFVEFA